MIENKLKELIRDVPNFPQQGIVFKDITPLLQEPELCKDILEDLVTKLSQLDFDVVAGIESRGFLFGLMLATRLGKPFVPIRKQGRLPYKTISESYKLEYGHATIEIHEDAIPSGAKVLIHDDLLATGGTVVAASNLVEKAGGSVAGFAFIITLSFLNGEERLHVYSPNVVSLIHY